MPRSRGVFDITLLDERPGFISVMCQGKDVMKIFADEAGGHRWQRVSPTEKRGRVHTSTVTVAILDLSLTEEKVVLNTNDLDIQTTRGSGPGGQHRNKVETCVVVTHVPTGITVRIDGRSQHQNKQTALRVLKSRLHERIIEEKNREQKDKRRSQVGSGMRGDKIRTYRTQDDQVVDHRTGQRWRLKDWLNGVW